MTERNEGRPPAGPTPEPPTCVQPEPTATSDERAARRRLLVDVLDTEDGPATLGTVLAAMGARWPNAPAVVAARLAVELIDAGREQRRAHREVSADVASAGGWRRLAHTHVPYAEMQRRRAVPGPLASER